MGICSVVMPLNRFNMPNKISLKEFIKRSKIKHNNKYNYSKIKRYYKKSSSKIPIICPQHGVFLQEARSHYEGSGCPKCGYNKVSKKLSLSLKEFIKRAKKIHKNKYDYSQVIYNGLKEKIKIICPKHGVFWQISDSHLRNCGCKKCSGNYKSNSKDFIKKSKKIHGNKYNYSLVNYKNAYTKIIIICKKHGTFKQKPNSHLCGYGCFKCRNYFLRTRVTKVTSLFVKQAKKIHGNLYDYSKTIYNRDNKPIIIICRKHGEFKQIANVHLSGCGCQKCNTSLGELSIAKFLKKNKIKYEIQKKFSACADNVPLPFDFYLPKLNICIEYDGEQHFKPLKIFGGLKRFKILNKHDKIKTSYCMKHKIKLIRISYKDKNIEAKLKKL
jgi:hypothetical protein